MSQKTKFAQLLTGVLGQFRSHQKAAISIEVMYHQIIGKSLYTFFRLQWRIPVSTFKYVWPLLRKQLLFFVLFWSSEWKWSNVHKKWFTETPQQGRLQGSISPTFYVQLLHAQIPNAQKIQSSCEFFTLLGSAVHKMLVKLTPGSCRSCVITVNSEQKFLKALLLLIFLIVSPLVSFLLAFESFQSSF